MVRPVTREVPAAWKARLGEIFERRGHRRGKNPKNPYIDFEARTDAKSIFTLYTSGKFVVTLREGDAEGLLLEAEIAELLGVSPSAPGAVGTGAGAGGAGNGGAGTGGAGNGLGGAAARRGGSVAAGTSESVRWLGGFDETGTGELIGTTVVAGALLPRESAEAVAAVTGDVDTKSSRTLGGWERLGHALADLRAEGLITIPVIVGNRLFDEYGKQALLDLAYVRAVGDVLAAAGLSDAEDLTGVEFVIDDYGIADLLRRAVERWRARGVRVIVQHKADDEHLAPRTAAVCARSVRAREMVAVAAAVDDGPIGTGNAGHGQTRRWLAHRARTGRGGPGGRWPSFVKASFKTARELDHLPPVEKTPLPALSSLLDAPTAEAMLDGRLDVETACWRIGDGAVRQLAVSPEGRLPGQDDPPHVYRLLPLLCGGLVLDRGTEKRLRADLDLLDVLLRRDEGLLHGWRLLIGPDPDPDDPLTLALVRAHHESRLHLIPTDAADPGKRASRHGGVTVTTRKVGKPKRLSLLLRT